MKRRSTTKIQTNISGWVWAAFVGVLVFTALTRGYRLGLPAEFIFDERYHVPAIQLMADNDPRAFEWWHTPTHNGDNFDWLHPPLAKYVQAFFFTHFGQNATAWRLGSAVFGVVGVALVFLVTQLAFKKPPLSVLAAFLLSLDGLWLVQSRVAMNDVFAAVWLLAAAAAYLWYQQRRKTEWLLLVGVLGGVALATKWSAGWWLMGIAVWELLADWRARLSQRIPWTFFALCVVPLTVYFVSYWPMFWQGKSMTYFFQLHAQIIRYEWSGTLPHPYQSLPWQWVFNLRPVWYWHGGDNQDIYALGNPLLSWLEVGALGYIVALLVRQRAARTTSPLAFLVMLFVLSFGPWLLVPRSAFYYHYTPAAPLGAIFLALWLKNFSIDRSRRSRVKALLFVTLACLVWVFWLYYPRWTGLPVSSEFSQAVYGLLPSWR